MEKEKINYAVVIIPIMLSFWIGCIYAIFVTFRYGSFNFISFYRSILAFTFFGLMIATINYLIERIR